MIYCLNFNFQSFLITSTNIGDITVFVFLCTHFLLCPSFFLHQVCPFLLLQGCCDHRLLHCIKTLVGLGQIRGWVAELPEGSFQQHGVEAHMGHALSSPAGQLLFTQLSLLSAVIPGKTSPIYLLVVSLQSVYLIMLVILFVSSWAMSVTSANPTDHVSWILAQVLHVHIVRCVHLLCRIKQAPHQGSACLSFWMFATSNVQTRLRERK